MHPACPLKNARAMDAVTTPLVIAGASSALVAGATGSVHCALMCGPLACAGLPSGPGRWRAALAWHTGRVSAYALVGGALGALGVGVSQTLTTSVQPLLPWVMAAGLIATALDVGRHLAPLPGLAGLSRRLGGLAARQSPTRRSLLLGAATPFLPCGLLYGVFLAAVATSSLAGGAAVMAAFALGAVPALGGVQAGAQLGARFPAATWALRRAVPLVAAGVLIFRAVQAATQGPACH